MSSNTIYCFSTTFVTTKPSDYHDYGVYKIGKTTRDDKKRFNEHRKYIETVLFSKKVYNCHSIEKYLIDKLNNHKNIRKRGDLGYEYYEGPYSFILEVLDEVTSEEFQNNNIIKMDVDHQCTICNRLFESEQGLNQHITKTHNLKLCL